MKMMMSILKQLLARGWGKENTKWFYLYGFLHLQRKKQQWKASFVVHKIKDQLHVWLYFNPENIFSKRAWPHKDSFSIPQEKCVLVLYVTSLPSSHSKLCQWTWATAVFGVVETAGLVSMAAPRPLTRAAQGPPHGLLLMFPSPPLGPASQLWWTPSAPPWWLSPSHKHNPSLADITCTPHVSVPPTCSPRNQTFNTGSITLSFSDRISEQRCCIWKIRSFGVP